MENANNTYGLSFKRKIEDADVNPEFLGRLPLSFVKKNLVFPLGKKDGKLMVAISSHEASYAIEDMARFYGCAVEPVLTPADEIVGAIHRFYEKLTATPLSVLEGISDESLETIAGQWEEPKDLLDHSGEAPMIRLLNTLFFQAVKERASDIHIEPFERFVAVRFRRDGVLNLVLSPPKTIQDALTSRVKIMAGLDIAEKRLPQDGRIRLLAAGKDVDVRVSIVPTAFGERVVLRLLDRKGGAVSLKDLGLSHEQTGTMEGFLRRTSGIVLVTGPTGSGKTTTLYAALNRINSEERNIITIEDPIEYQLKGVGQIQVNAKIGLEFASGLRSILRQDPDVIMVGEIRDPETAQMAIQASLTGHLVLSTLHTNDAPGAIARLVDMGVQSFLLSSSLSAVLAQRLVRTLCNNCKQGHRPNEAEAAMFRNNCPEALYRSVGCGECFKTGYAGQTGIFEFMPIDDELRQVFLKNVDSATIRGAALSKGMKSLKDSGLEKAASGVTSLEEVIRVTHEGREP